MLKYITRWESILILAMVIVIKNLFSILVIYVATCFFVFMTAFQTTRNQIETLTKADVNVFIYGISSLELRRSRTYLISMHLCCCHDWIFLFRYYFACRWSKRRLSYRRFWILVINLSFYVNICIIHI